MNSNFLDTMLQELVRRRGSDLHLQVGAPPVFRVDGELLFSEHEFVTSPQMESYVAKLILNGEHRNLEELKRTDLSYTLEGVSRFRTNIFKQRGQFGIAMRAIPFQIPTLKDIGAPPVLEELAAKPHGLVLLTGPAGSGKSTTLAAIIDSINERRMAHIITIEDPIEFLHSNKRSLIDQREVGRDTPCFAGALHDALREDPDVVLVGEMRDLDTISNAVTAAETGHLVFATLHTNDVVQAVDRIIDVFPPHQQNQIRMQIASSLQGVIAQVLVRKKDGSGRMAAFETLTVNPAVRNLIKEARTSQIYHCIQTGRRESMLLMKDSLKMLCQKKIITPEEAKKYVLDAAAFDRSLEPLDVLFKKVNIDVTLTSE